MAKTPFPADGGAMSKISRRLFMGGIGAGFALPSAPSAEPAEPETLEQAFEHLVERIKFENQKAESFIHKLSTWEDGAFDFLIITAHRPDKEKQGRGK